MTAELKKLRELQADELTKSEAIRSKYSGRLADMTATEQKAWEDHLSEADRLASLIDAEEKAQKLDAFQKAIPNEVQVVDEKTGKVIAQGQDVAEKAAFQRYLMGSLKGIRQEDIGVIQGASALALPNATLKGQAIGDPIDGGYLVAPVRFVTELIKELNELMTIRDISRTFTVTDASSLGVVTLDTDLDDFDWTVELATGSEDDVDFGKRAMTPHPLAKRIKMSKTLLRKAMMDPEALLRERLAYKLARTHEKAFMTGTGAQRPLGVFTASALGISTGRDHTSAVSNVIDGDDVIDCVAALKPQYHGRAVWVLHRLWLAHIRKLKDDAGNYIWTPFDMQGKAIVGANPGTLMGFPYRLSEDAPGTVSGGNYAAILGDFQYYWIVDALTMQIQVLTELYAETNQNGYICRQETDAMPVQEDAFIRLKMKA